MQPTGKYIPKMAQALVLILATSSSTLFAQGAIEIHAACVQTGCFTDDAPGFPVEIEASGVYRLASDLDLTEIASGPIRIGIVISSSDVRLDLSGFNLIGSSVCTGNNPDCMLFPFSEIGIIVATGTSNVVIENGSVNGMGSNGILVENTRDLVIRDVRISDTAGTGLVATGTGFIDQVRIGNNGGFGIFMNSPSFHVRDGLFINNGGLGVEGGYCSRNVFVTNSTLTGTSQQEACLFLIENNFCEATPC